MFASVCGFSTFTGKFSISNRACASWGVQFEEGRGGGVRGLCGNIVCRHSSEMFH